MATITLKYDARNPIAKKTIDYVLSLGIFETKEKTSALDQSLQEAKEGNVNRYENINDFFEKFSWVMYKIQTTNRFEKEVLKCKKRGFNLDNLKEVMSLLAKDGILPAKYKPHKLSGNYSNCWECHIKPDWLLI